MAKTDPKDDRIQELELALVAANAATEAAQRAAQDIGALKGDVAIRDAEIKRLAEALREATATIDGMKTQVNHGAGATVTGLNAKTACQLKVSCVLTNAVNGSRIDAVEGDVIATKDSFVELQSKLGTTVRVHPVDVAEVEAAKKFGRAH